MMLMPENYKEVDFHYYCPRCKHEKESEDSDICYECLNEPAILYSHKPIKFEEKEK